MFSVPVTFLADFKQVNASARRFILHEFAADGVKNLVFSAALTDDIMRDHRQAKQLQREMDAETCVFLKAVQCEILTIPRYSVSQVRRKFAELGELN